LAESIPFWQADRLGFSPPAAWANMEQVMLEAGLLAAPQDLSQAYSNEFVP
jgi:NitT/TauT family transport system substrate-binding protein